MERAAQLNRDCQCITVDREKLNAALVAAGLKTVGSANDVSPMFADVPVFLAQTEIEAIRNTVEAVRRVVALPAFQEQALSHAPPIAAHDHGPVGTLYGYDFHLTPDGPRLIEINTNAGGALLSLALWQTQVACCDEVTAAVTPHVPMADRVPHLLVAGFVRELQRQRGENATLTTVAIVDEQPQQQFLHPEFLLYQRLFEQHGINALIVDVTALLHRDGALWAGETRIDLVYNRLTDFYFETDATAALRSAYEQGDVVVTPNPRAHALYANKRHLVMHSNADELARVGVAVDDIASLTRVVPHAELLDDANRERLWAERKHYFFKPLCGYGSKAAYRGDKLTRKTWDAIAQGDYIAQQLAVPSERTVNVDGRLTPLKLDVRAYVDDEQVLFLASRLYQGQTTNFRTPGGGFASVFTTVAR